MILSSFQLLNLANDCAQQLASPLEPLLSKASDLVRFGLPQHALQFLFPKLWPEAEADAAG